MMKLARFVGLLILALAALSPERAAAQNETTQKVEALYAEGAALYRAGKYRQAVERFEEAYAIYPEPNLLFNAAKSYEALGEHDKAIDAYQRCASSPEASAEVRTKASARVEMLKKAKLKSDTAPAEDDPLPPANAPVRVTSAAPVEDRGSSFGTVKWIAAAGGAALIASGAVVFLMGSSDHNQVNDAIDAAGSDGVATLTYREADDLVAKGSQKKSIGVALLGAGGAVAVGAITLFVLDGGDREPRASLSAALQGDGGRLVLGGVF